MITLTGIPQSQNTSKRSVGALVAPHTLCCALSHMPSHTCAHKHCSSSLLSGRKSVRWFRNLSGVPHTPSRVEHGNAFKVPASTAHNWSPGGHAGTPDAQPCPAQRPALQQPSGERTSHPATVPLGWGKGRINQGQEQLSSFIMSPLMSFHNQLINTLTIKSNVSF